MYRKCRLTNFFTRRLFRRADRFVVDAQGYVYGCTSAICESMGQCTCSIEEWDLEGGDSSSMVSSTWVCYTGYTTPFIHKPELDYM